jgi:hypothetical protein
MSYDDQMRIRERRDPMRKFLPAMGMILVVAFGAISWVLHEPLRDLLVEQISSLPRPNQDGFKEVGYVAGGTLFIVLVMLAALFYAAFAPKPDKKVSNQFLKEEKRMRELAKRDKQLRQREVRQAMSKERKSKANSTEE